MRQPPSHRKPSWSHPFNGTLRWTESNSRPWPFYGAPPNSHSFDPIGLHEPVPPAQHRQQIYPNFIGRVPAIPNVRFHAVILPPAAPSNGPAMLLQRDPDSAGRRAFRSSCCLLEYSSCCLLEYNVAGLKLWAGQGHTDPYLGPLFSSTPIGMGKPYACATSGHAQPPSMALAHRSAQRMMVEFPAPYRCRGIPAADARQDDPSGTTVAGTPAETAVTHLSGWPEP